MIVKELLYSQYHKIFCYFSNPGSEIFIYKNLVIYIIYNNHHLVHSQVDSSF